MSADGTHTYLPERVDVKKHHVNKLCGRVNVAAIGYVTVWVHR